MRKEAAFGGRLSRAVALSDETVAWALDLAALRCLDEMEAEQSRALSAGVGNPANEPRPPGLYSEPDGTYTHIHPDGSIEYLKDDVLV